MSRLAPSGDLADEIHAGERAPVLLYCRAGKKLPYVFCGELGCVGASLMGSTGLQQEDDEGMQQQQHGATDPLLVWKLLDYDELVGGSKHFRNLTEFWEVGI